MTRLAATLAVIVTVVTSVVGLDSTLPASATTEAIPPPSSMAATGDSFTAGYATGSPACDIPTPRACSWSTGPAVNSHYQRLVALNPALAGHATNAAVLGSVISTWVGQINTVKLSHPDYVTVLIGGGDLCFAPTTTPAQFGAGFRMGMDALFAASPDSRVLVGSIWNFESLRAAALPNFASLCGQAFFGAPDDIRAAFMGRLVQFNAVLESECATYPNCRFDGYALFNHAWTRDEVSTVDYLHPSAAGQEMISQVLFDAGYRWAVQAADRDDCKDDGWKTVVDNGGRSFKNQGDCVNYVETGR